MSDQSQRRSEEAMNMAAKNAQDASEDAEIGALLKTNSKSANPEPMANNESSSNGKFFLILLLARGARDGLILFVLLNFATAAIKRAMEPTSAEIPLNKTSIISLVFWLIVLVLVTIDCAHSCIELARSFRETETEDGE